MKSQNGHIRVKAGEAKKVLGLEKSGMMREEGCWSTVLVLVGSRRSWFSQGCAGLVTDTETV